MNNPSTTSANHDSSAHWSTINDRSSATDSTTSSATSSTTSSSTITTTSSATSSSTTSQSTTSTYNPDDGGGTIYTDSGNYNGNVVPSYESTEAATNTDSSSTTNNYGTYETPATKGNPNGEPNYQTVKTDNNISTYDSLATNDPSSDQSNYAKSSTPNDISRAVTIPGVGLVAPSGETITADEYIAARKQEAAEKIKQINDESVRLTHNQTTISNDLEGFKVNGSSLGSGTYGDDANGSGPTELPVSPDAYDSIIKKINNDIKDSQKLMNAINEFNTKYSDLDINSDDLNEKNKEIKDHIGKASEKRDELVATRDKVDEVNQNLNNLFKDEVVEVYEDGSKSVTKGSTQYNYDADGNLLSTVERDKNGNILNIDATKSSALPNIKTQVFEDGSKTVTEGDVKRNYDADGKLLSTVKTTHEPGFTKTEIEAEEGSALKNSTIKVYDEDGSKTVIEDNVERNYDKEGNLLSTVETTKEPGMTIKKITTGEGSGLKDSVVKIYDEDGSKTVIEGNIQKNYDGNGKLLSTVETTKEPGVTITNIKTEVGSGLKDSVVKVYDEDGSKTVIEGNKQYNYDREGRILSVVETDNEGLNIGLTKDSGLINLVPDIKKEDPANNTPKSNPHTPSKEPPKSNGDKQDPTKMEQEQKIPEYEVDFTKYQDNPNNGFFSWMSDNKFTLDDLMKSDFAKSDYAKEHGYDTPEKLMEAFAAVVISESNKTPEDVLAIMSVIGNRCELYDNWKEDKGTTNPIDMLFALRSNGAPEFSAAYVTRPGTNEARYEAYIPSKYGENGIDEVNKILDSAQGNSNNKYTYEELRDVVYDAYFGGARNNLYSGYYSGWTGDGSPNPTYDEGHGGNHYYNNVSNATEMNKLHNLEAQLDNYQKDYTLHNLNSSSYDTNSSGGKPVVTFDLGNGGSKGGIVSLQATNTPNNNGPRLVNTSHTTKTDNTIPTQSTSTPYSGQNKEIVPNSIGSILNNPEVKGNTDAEKLAYAYNKGFIERPDYKKAISNVDTFTGKYTGPADTIVTSSDKVAASQTDKAVASTVPPTNQPPTGKASTNTTNTNPKPEVSTGTVTNTSSNKIADVLNNPEVKGNTDAEKLAYAYNKGFIERPDYKKAMSNVDTFTGKYNGPLGTEVSEEPVAQPPETKVTPPARTTPNPKPDSTKPSTNANAAAANQPQTNVESSNKPVEENKNMFSVRSSTIDSELEKELENAPTKYYEDGSYSKTIGNTKYSYDKEGNLLHTAETITENGVTITNIEATKDSKLESGIIRINNETGQKEIINNHTEKIYDGAGNKVYDLEKNTAGDYVKLDEYDPQNGNTRHIDFGKDANGNRIEKYIEERHDGNLLYTIEQDANGNINGQKYDTSGRVVEHQYMDSNAKTTTYTNYAYNNKGDKYEEAVSAYDSTGLLYSLQKNENGDIIDCSVAKQGSIPTDIDATYYKDGVKIDIEGGKKRYSYSQRYKFDDEGNIPEKEKINGSYLNGWDVDYYNEYASNWYDNKQRLKALGATAEDPHQCGYINLYEGAVTSERDGCSAFSTASVFATINGGTTVVDANGNEKEISPVEILALYPGKNSNTGEFMKVASDYYGFEYSTEISFSDDNNKYLKNLLKNGGGSVTAVDSSANEKFAKGDKPAIHYVAVDDYYEDANGVGYFHVTDPFVNLEDNSNNLELGQWYSENSVEWQNINNCHNYSAMVAPKTMSVEEACGYQRAS